MTKLLVTAISGNVATGILRSLSGHGYCLFGCDVGEYPAGIDLVKCCYRVPYAVEEDYVSKLLQICDTEKIQAIIPVNETELEVLDQNRSVFFEREIKLVMNNTFILHTCLDKYICMRELEKIGVRVPRTTLSENFYNGMGDCILKPRSGCGSKFLKRVSTAEEVRMCEREFRNSLIVQEYLPDEENEYTMGVFSDGETTRCIIFRRRLTHGYTTYVELVHDEKMEEIGQVVAEKWRLCGSINIQMRQKNGTPYVFEINPRLSGTTHFRALLGFHDALWWCKKVFGQSISPYIPPYREAIGLREMNEKIILAQ